jgi:hypothetical protein
VVGEPPAQRPAFLRLVSGPFPEPVKESGVFDDLKTTRAETKINAKAHTVDVTLYFNK